VSKPQVQLHDSLPFKGRVGEGMGDDNARYPTPILTFPLRGKEGSYEEKK